MIRVQAFIYQERRRRFVTVRLHTTAAKTVSYRPILYNHEWKTNERSYCCCNKQRSKVKETEMLASHFNTVKADMEKLLSKYDSEHSLRMHQKKLFHSKLFEFRFVRL